ncbi:MAG: alpha/beta fold hydrolase [Rhodospirillales bacterium]|nr:alpha/beta fold hydrolase [Rhodospirillales bacterium]MDE2318430.1 alpha/beta fold hydrolase [Rhodospirillales bacterium]
MASFILVPGAWHGAWCWSLLAPLLEKAGHRVFTPELSQTPPGANPLPLWARQIAALAATAPEPAILVGHSRGGLVISEAAGLAPHSIARLVYLSGFLLTAGQTMQSTMAQPEAGAEPDYLRPARGRCLTVAAEAIIPRFYHLTNPETARSAAARQHPEPLGTFSAAATLPPPHIPRAYIECTEDRVLPLALQRAMHAALPCAQIFTLPADHSPFFSVPAQLATTLLATV